MWRPGKANPTLIAHGGAKCGTIMKIPGNVMAINIQCAFAGVLVDRVSADPQVKWRYASSAEIEFIQREALDISLGRLTSREPGGPNLDRLYGQRACSRGVRVRIAAAASGIGEQISEPPGTCALR